LAVIIQLIIISEHHTLNAVNIINMNFRIIIVFIYFCFVNATFAQYKSDITKPDVSKPVVRDFEIPRVRYAENITPRELKMHLDVLASPEFEGRETGTPGNDKAADYISKYLYNLGLSAIPGADDYKQSVAFTFSKWLNNEIGINNTKYKHLWDYLVFPSDNAGENIEADEVAFLGYGIDDEKYSDYKKANVKGKVIMINKGEPMINDSISFLTGSNQLSSWSNDMSKKLKVAKENGAKAVLIIDNDIKKTLEVNRKKVLGSFLELGDLKNKKFDLPTHVYISSTMATEIIGEKQKKILKARKKIAKGKPASAVLSSKLLIQLEKEVKVLSSNNVIGLIEGKDKKDEYIFVSAHFDHLGKRGDDIYYGADDNGSGSSMLLEIAQSFQQAVMEGQRPSRNVVFCWFTGEEKGLLGSQYYTEYPLFPLKNTIVNVNVDMIGRTDENYNDFKDYTYVIGSDRLSTDLHKINEEMNQTYTQLLLDYKYNDEKDPNQFYYRSDHYNFASRGVPAIFFFTGVHKDYHRTTDTADKIQFDKMANIGKLIFHTVYELANRSERIKVDKEIK
jgi:hypothetical protein